LHSLGYRFRLHRKDLPGTPDIVLPRHRIAIMVHGCFWHRHDCPKGRSLPEANRERWVEKFEKNVLRDERERSGLEAAGWRVVVIWECETSDRVALARTLQSRIEER